MRQNHGIFKHVLLFVLAMALGGQLLAQTQVSGTVRDAMGPLPGVTVAATGVAGKGTITDYDGKFSFELPAEATGVTISFIGYKTVALPTQSTPYDVVLEEETEFLDEVVVIGYGKQKKEDNTGAVTAVGEDEFNKGAIVSPSDLLVGRTAGVQITTGGGAPGEGATIRIRGGSSLSASNDPLIVIDGVPLDTEGVAGMSNPLSSINPNDIETFTILKDASATAIYGSRASNGVIIITTKKGRKGSSLSLNYSGLYSIFTVPNTVEVLSADEFRTMVANTQSPEANAILGDASTNWQDEIFQTSFGHDHSIGAAGSLKGVPFRASIGYTDQNGILMTSDLERWTGSLNLNPTFFNDALKVNIAAKGMNIQNRFADRGAIGSAIFFDPTQPVSADGFDNFGGYFTWTDQNGNRIPIATSNPVALLEQRQDLSTVNRFIGNIQFDYALPFLPDLRANLNLGIDASNSDGTIDVPIAAGFSNIVPGIKGGTARVYDQQKSNELLDFYLNYTKATGIGNFDVMAGYSWQHFWRAGTAFQTNLSDTTILDYFDAEGQLLEDFHDPSLRADSSARYPIDIVENSSYETESYLVSFFGRLNYSIANKYLFTATVRQDGSSRFVGDNKWGLFPSYAFAWKLKEESFLAGVDAISELKLRVGYGITGQQNIGAGDYPALARYTGAEGTAYYQLGDQFIRTFRPEGYDANLKWEETTTLNVGLDYGFANERIVGSIELYQRATTDLLNVIPVPAGTNLTNQILTNVGDLENRGVEFSITGRPISKTDMFWEVSLNATYNENEITKLTASEDPNYLGVFTGGISGGTGNTVQIHSVGHPASTFFVYEQVYGANGMPIEGLFVDRNDDGVISPEDRYHAQDPAADLFFGFMSRFEYKNFDFSFAGRAQYGNYVYNNMLSQASSYGDVYISAGFITNRLSNIDEVAFQVPRYESDHFLEHAAFLRMDNISVGYNLQDVVASRLDARISATLQNAFVVTKYSGLDPEVGGGIDNNFYPRPRTIVLGLNMNF